MAERKGASGEIDWLVVLCISDGSMTNLLNSVDGIVTAFRCRV